jgi:hypothetical protein
MLGTSIGEGKARNPSLPDARDLSRQAAEDCGARSGGATSVLATTKISRSLEKRRMRSSRNRRSQAGDPSRYPISDAPGIELAKHVSVGAPEALHERTERHRPRSPHFR